MVNAISCGGVNMKRQNHSACSLAVMDLSTLEEVVGSYWYPRWGSCQ